VIRPACTYALPTVADGRHETEEHEHSYLPQAEVAVRLRPARVEPGSGDGRCAHEEQPWRDHERQDEPNGTRHPEGNKRCPADLPGAGESGSDEAPGSDPVESVRAPEAVGQVVGEVHADLEGEGHNQCGQRPPPDDAVTDTHRH